MGTLIKRSEFPKFKGQQSGLDPTETDKHPAAQKEPRRAGDSRCVIHEHDISSLIKMQHHVSAPPSEKKKKKKKSCSA